MKKTYKSIMAFIVLLSIVAMKLGAQPLSGLYTIDSQTGTNWPNGTNFQTFSAFAATVNANGVNGPVSVDVLTATGPYVEQVQFMQITGASAVNRIVINGNFNLLTFNSTNAAQPWTLFLNGTDYLNVNDLNIEGTGPNYALAAMLTNIADYNSFTNCTFKSPVNGTATGHCPFSISGSGTSATTSGNGGNNNTITTCTMSNGYYSVGNYAPTGAPYQVGRNSFISCRFTDWYAYGFYCMYSQNLTVRNCVFDRITRTSSTTTYVMQGYQSSGMMFEGNLCHKIFEANQGVVAAFYYTYNYGNVVPALRNIYRNNILTNIKNNSTTYGFYNYTSACDIYNNTLDFDYGGATAAITLQGIYTYGTATDAVTVTNNIITCRRGGSGTSRYGVYFGNAVNSICERNNIIMTPATGATYIGFYNAAHQTLAAWQAAGRDITGFSVDPMYTSTVDLHPTNAVINNQAMPAGLYFDQEIAVRNQNTPDIGALEFLTPMCAGVPTNYVGGASYQFCPGEKAYLGIGLLNPDAGFTYQWQNALLSPVGPFVNVPGATGIFYTTPPLINNTWYNVVITCTAPNGGVSAPVATITMAGLSTSVVPYYEDFENLGRHDRLPNCSWLAPNIGGAAKTFTSPQTGNRLPCSGNGLATFDNGSPGTNYYYTNGIYLEPNITYSTSLWFKTDFTGATNWSDMSILLGTAQTPAGLVSLASTNGPAVSPICKSLSGIFTVNTPGLYYVAVRATSGVGTAQYLSWDDLRIEIPCTNLLNVVPVQILMGGANSSTICNGTGITLSASGANTWVWNTGALTAVISVTPNTTTMYVVTGTSTLTMCKGTASQLITVKPSPAVAAFAVPSSICNGKSSNLQASGATTYTWNVGGSGGNVNVSPGASTGYTVIGTTAGCTGKANVFVTVNSLPVVSTIGSNPQICVGEPVQLNGSGALTYMWTSNTGMILQGSQPLAYGLPEGQSSFTLAGTDANGCQGMATFNVNVEKCVGLNKVSGIDSGIKLFPNPSNGELNIESDHANFSVNITDVSGRLVMTNVANGKKTKLNISTLAAGVYYVSVKSASATNVVKVIKE